MERKCLQCGATIQGRADKKFCCDDCRTDYHNGLRRQREKGLACFLNRVDATVASILHDCSIVFISVKWFVVLQYACHNFFLLLA